ncbi:MAG: hypothetical protein ABIT47_04155, partial [Candidatus Paceibacterota bacterium]
YTFSTPGTYYYRLCADLNSSWVGSVTESNEGNNCGAWSSITVAAVVPPTPTCSLSANPPGVPSTLTWSSTNATTCTGGGFSTGGATAGTAPVGTAGSYTLSCSGAGGSCPVQSVTVGAAACSNPTPTISATPARIHAGDPVTISYSATGVNSCTIVGPGVSKSATVASCSVSPSTALVPAGTIQTQATYTITCDGVSKQTIVNVIPQFQEF